MIPTVEDLTSAPLTHRFGDLFNPPALTNFRGSVQAAIDITAIRCLNFPPFATSDTFPPVTWSDSVTGALFVDGRYFASTGQPVTFVWRPDRIVRRSTYDGLRLRSDTVLPMGRTAAIVRLRVRNVSGASRRVHLRFGFKATITMNTSDWDRPIAPAEFDNEVSADATRKALLFEARHSTAVSLQGCVPLADAVRAHGVEVSRTLRSGAVWELYYLNVIAEDGDEARATYDALAQAPEHAFARARDDWNAELAAAFTPGNDRYSGALPRLETADEDLQHLYHQGMLGVVYFKRETPRAVTSRTYTTLMPRYWQTISWLWDHQLSSIAHVMLDPSVTRAMCEQWMALDIHQIMGTNWMTGQGLGSAYAINDYAIIKIAHDYVRWSGDEGWLGRDVTTAAGTSHAIIDRLQSYAEHWQTLRTPAGLADYGGLSNLLECVAAYTHEVAGLNAANVYGLRAVAAMLAATGRSADARRLVDEAERLLPRIQTLYREGEGFWCARHRDGRLEPVRHCFDFHTILNTIGGDLSARQRDEMVRFFREDLQTPTWMHALSPRDADAIFDIRPDHQWTGAYVAWPAEAATALLGAGEVTLARDWIRGLARTARQGPFGQAHFVEAAVAPEADGARKAPSEFPFLTDWACVAGGSWVRLIVEGIFGVDASLREGLSAQPRIKAFDPAARLRNVPYQGRLYTIDASGVHAQERAV